MPKKQKSGLYRTKIKIGVTPAGKDIVKWISGSTKAELEQARNAVLKKYILGEGVKEDWLFGDYAVHWFKVHKAPTLSPSSLEAYRTALNKEIFPEFADRQLRAISAADIQEFINRFANMSATKITYTLATLRGIFRQACADSIIQKDPTKYIKKPKSSVAKEKYIISEEERKIITQVCERHEHGAYVACMFYLGLRPGEARGLMWGDFDWNKNLVHIQRDIDFKAKGYAGALKTATSNRYVPVPLPLQRLLKPLQGAPGDFLFKGELSGTALSKTTSDRMWVSVMADCGLVQDVDAGTYNYREGDIRLQYKPIFTPHTLRHNYITMCWENGIDAYTTMKLVGHKSIKTTMDIYTHLSNKQMGVAADQLNKMFGGTEDV